MAKPFMGNNSVAVAGVEVETTSQTPPNNPNSTKRPVLGRTPSMIRRGSNLRDDVKEKMKKLRGTVAQAGAAGSAKPLDISVKTPGGVVSNSGRRYDVEGEKTDKEQRSSMSALASAMSFHDNVQKRTGKRLSATLEQSYEHDLEVRAFEVHI
jgi:hypothetical protein